MKDRYYPSYHFRPEKNWMNDPNGLIFQDGVYHMFYQYNPFGDQWGTIHWGHAASRDLIHCYSGCAVEWENAVYLFYTSVGAGERGPERGAQQWSAVSRDGLRTFQKLERPAIPQSLHGEEEVLMWRDPFLWREEGEWFAVLGGSSGKKGCLWLYRSKDLRQWEYLNRIFETEEFPLTECPNLIPFGKNRYLLLYSPLDAVRYCVGRLDREHWRFEAERTGVFDHSIEKRGFYAPNTYLTDPKHRKIVFGWLSEADGKLVKERSGWAGMQSLPREVWLEKDGEIRVWPVKECEILRKKRLLKQDGEKRKRCLSCRGRNVEISLKFDTGAEDFSIRFFESGDGREYTKLYYRKEEGRLYLDRSRASLWEGMDGRLLSCPLRGDAGTEIRVFLDHSAIEVFADRRETITARVYPRLEGSDGISVDMKKGTVEIWQMER